VSAGWGGFRSSRFGERNLFGDLNTKALETHDLSGMVRQQMDCGEAKVGEDLSANPRIVLYRLMPDVRNESRLISSVRQQFPMPVTRNGRQAGPRLMQIKENAAIRFRYFAESPLNQLLAIAVE
jgi:hypothetical protein